MKLPNIWGQGALFAFSGLDGECRVHSCLNCALLGDLLGVRVHARETFDLYVVLDGIKDIQYDIVASDVIKARLKDAQGSESDVIFTFLDQKTIVGLCGQGRAQLRSLRALNETRTEHGLVFKSGTSVFNFWRQDTEGVTLFSFSTDSFVPVSRQQVEELCQKRIDFIERFASVSIKDEDIRLTFLKSVSVMKSQVYTTDGQFMQRWTTPNRLPHRWLWLWDSVFHSFGNILLDETLPAESLKSVFDVQKEDGFIPHLARPSFTSDITQPPLLAWGVLRLYERTGDIEFVREMLPKLEKYLNWSILNRTHPQSGLFCWHVNTKSENCRADESGMDNSPRFDGVSSMECIDYCCFMLNEYECMEKLVGALGEGGADKWHERHEELKRKINERLWDAEDEFYYDRVTETNNLHKVHSVASFLPLFAGACDDKTAKILVSNLQNPETFNTVLPIPSVARNEMSFDCDMWRGSVWVNYNYMISLGLRRYGYNELANDILIKTVKAMSHLYMADGVIYEMYDPDDRLSPRRLMRKGPPIEPYDPRVRYQSIRDYGWSSTLYAAIINENQELFV